MVGNDMVAITRITLRHAARIHGVEISARSLVSGKFTSDHPLVFCEEQPALPKTLAYPAHQTQESSDRTLKADESKLNCPTNCKIGKITILP